MMDMDTTIGSYSCNKYGIFYNGTLVIRNIFGLIIIQKQLIDQNTDLISQFEQNGISKDKIYISCSSCNSVSLCEIIDHFIDICTQGGYLSEPIFHLVHNTSLKFRNVFINIVKNCDTLAEANTMLGKKFARIKNKKEEPLKLSGLWYTKC